MNNDGVLINIPVNRINTSIFYGLRKGERVPDGYFSDMNNFSSDKFPCLSTRNTRMNMTALNQEPVDGEPVCIAEYDDGILVALSNGNVSLNNKTFDINNEIRSVSKLGKQMFFIPGGAVICEEPDEVKYAGVYKKGNFTLSYCDSTSENIEVNTEDKPENPENGTYWYDKANKGLYRYSSYNEMWNAVPTAYFRIMSDGYDFSEFREGDALRLTTDKEYIDTFISAVYSDCIVAEGIISAEYIDQENLNLIIERRFPALQYICSHNNRIWGCYYDGDVNEIYASKLGDPLNWYCYHGISTDSYAVSCGEAGEFTGCSELGDSVVFFKENCIYTVYGNTPSDFQTVKTDCFGVQKGSEKSICRINGLVYYKSCHGIMRLSEGSLPVCISDELGKDIWKDAIAESDGQKYYIIMTDINNERSMYVYDIRYEMWHKEDIPCSGVFSLLRFKNNILCAGKTVTEIKSEKPVRKGPKQYPAPKREEYTDFLKYITAINIWMANNVAAQMISRMPEEKIREMVAAEKNISAENVTNAEIREFCDRYTETEDCYKYNVCFLYLDSNAGCNAFIPINTTDMIQSEEGRFHFCAVTGIRGLESSEFKRLKGLEIRMKLNDGARLGVAVQYDETGSWDDIATFDESGTNTFRFTGKLGKCDTYRLMFNGYGQVVIYSITEAYEEAGTVGI